MQLKPISNKLRDALTRASKVDQRDALARANQADPAAATATPQARVVAQGTDTVDLLMYGPIGGYWWDDESVTAKSVVDALKDFTGSTINVRINSIGGSVSDGIAIHNELRRHAKRGAAVNGTVDGLACSIASLVIAACDTVTMPSNALQMLHAPWGSLYIEGNAKDTREIAAEFASMLDVMGSAMAQSYARKSGKPVEHFLAMWETGADHWYSAADAKAEGLCDIVDDALEADAAEASASVSAAYIAALTARAPESVRANLRAVLHTDTPAPATAPGGPDSQASAGAQAALSAATTPEEITMDPTKPADNPTTAALAAATTAALAQMRQRNADIKAVAEPHFSIPAVRSYYDEVIASADPAIQPADVGARILAIIAQDRGPLNAGGHVRASGGDDRKGQRDAMTNAIEARAGLAKLDGANPFRGESLYDIARACAEQVGVSTRGMGRMDVVATAITHTTSDFPGLVGGVAERSLMRGYTEIELDLAQIARPVPLSDFRPTNPTGLGAFSDLDKVPESGEYKYGTFSARNGMPLRAATFGKLFSVSRQAIINDDIGLLTDVPFKMGQAAKRTVVKELFALLVSNPTMPDGVALFHASRGNLMAAGAISTASVDAMRVAMGAHAAADGTITGVQLANLLTPLTLGGLARSVRVAQYVVDADVPESRQPNYVQNTFDVIDTARLSGTGWYGLGNAMQSDGLVIGYLDGKQVPYLEQETTFTVDGVAWKVRLDAGVGIGDPQALSYNPGE